MALTKTGRHKAALLLMSLDSVTASELLKDLPPIQIQELSVEMARIHTQGAEGKKESKKVISEFVKSLRKNRTQGLNLRNFFSEVLPNVLDDEKAREVQGQIENIIERKDPFGPVHSATNDELAIALQNESPNAVAVLLSELNPRKAAELLPMLDKDACSHAVWYMANPTRMNTKIKNIIASVVCKRLKGLEGATVLKDDVEIFRDVAIMLSDVELNLRNETLEAIKGRDENVGKMIRDLMITWQDIPTIADRSLQEVLRTVDSKVLAIAMYQVDEEIDQKIRSNISQRAVEMLEEEIGLLQEPLETEINEARDKVIEPLRDANEEGTLRRVR